jgi:hypothetical protein
MSFHLIKNSLKNISLYSSNHCKQLKTFIMKKIIIPVLFVSLAAFVFSCQKESNQLRTAPSGNQPPNVAAGVEIVSDWLSMEFTRSEESSDLEATTYFHPTSAYDRATHTQLAFARKMQGDSYGYQSLPGMLVTESGSFSTSFVLTYSSFTVVIGNQQEIRVIPGQDFSEYQFRYLVVPNSVIESNLIDWNDYEVVAAALNMAL